MKIEIKVPAMGESISEATVGSFLKNTGTQVNVDDELLELETDKVNQVLYAPQAGIINWQAKKDDVVKIGQVLGYIDTDKAGAPEKETAKKVSKEFGKEPAQQTVEKMPPTLPPPSTPKEKTETAKKERSEDSARITKERIVSELIYAPSRESAKPAKVESSTSLQQSASKGERKETRKKMTKIRKVIANRLVDVLQQTAMLTTFNEVDMSNIISLRETYKDAFMKKYNAKLGFMSFFVSAAVSALKAFPEVNAYIEGDEIVYREYFDIGIAVGTDRGLIVPVVRNCDQLSFSGIEQTIENFAKKAREGGLSADDLQGGGFTITNGGVYGSLLSTPILNPPQSAILGMHKIQKRAVVIDDAIVIRPMMYLALSYDHRIVDGKEAVSFLIHIKNCLEDPSRILLDI